MYPGTHARSFPDKPAIIDSATAETISFAQLDERSARLAGCLSERGMARGDTLALFMENHPRYLEVAWAALRGGFYLVTVSRYATVDDVAYMVNDSGARALVTSPELADTATQAVQQTPDCAIRLMVDSATPGWENYQEALEAAGRIPLEHETQGDHMPYSSGTTGRPKGIRRPLPEGRPADGFASFEPSRATYGFGEDTVYLSPAPLYHTAPIQFCLRVLAFGGTVVVMPRFDPQSALRAIERYRVTHSQWVPTMFVRMLKLPEAERAGFDLGSHRCAIHAAAPCPVEVKRQMIDWWGPIIEEYYAGSERNGATRISSEEWLRKPGSVGMASNGVVHICDEDGVQLPPGEAGIIYFELPDQAFSYHNDPAKTKDSRHPQHPDWSTLGDIGYLDEDDYLFLTDRKSFMIISGGVNIYPRMIEDVLILHPEVADVAVIGVPNAEFGEEVKAIVEAAVGVAPDEELEQRLLDYARGHLAHYMVPRSVDFIDRMPRLPTGKLPKKVLREPYWRDSAREARA